MTSVMLATYPEVFAGGAIIAGLPYGIASNVREALNGMMQSPPRPAGELGDLVRNASNHKGPWPKLSVWHGSADRTVNPEMPTRSSSNGSMCTGCRSADVGRGCRWLSPPGLVECGRRDRGQILYHHQHGPRHPARIADNDERYGARAHS